MPRFIWRVQRAPRREVSSYGQIQPSPRWSRTGSLRDWFAELVTEDVDEEDPPPMSLFRLCGLLWNCTDCMPSDLREEVRERWLHPYAVYANIRTATRKLLA